MIVYKVTNFHGYTMNATHWAVGTTHRAIGTGTALCTNDVIHVYLDPQLAVIFNPIHVDFSPCKLWKGEGDIVVADATKAGVKSLTILEELPIPYFTNRSLVAFAVLCAKAVYANPLFTDWANNWLNGINRSHSIASAIATATQAARVTGRRTVPIAATQAAHYAAQAAYVYAVYNDPSYNAPLAAYHAAEAACTMSMQLNFTELFTQAVALVGEPV